MQGACAWAHGNSRVGGGLSDLERISLLFLDCSLLAWQPLGLKKDTGLAKGLWFLEIILTDPKLEHQLVNPCLAEPGLELS